MGQKYKGFVAVRCEECGALRLANLLDEADSLLCRQCGHRTKLQRLANANLKCPKCGMSWHYMTNVRDSRLEVTCILCEETMVSRWDGKLNRFRPERKGEEENA